MARRQIEVTVRASCPKGMKASHFRQLIKDNLAGGGGIYLSIHDQMLADTTVGRIKPNISAARILKHA